MLSGKNILGVGNTTPNSQYILNIDAKDADWLETIKNIWQDLPKIVKIIVSPLSIYVVPPTDTRLKGANAAAYHNKCIISTDAEPEELIHEIGHILIEICPNNFQQAEDYYNFEIDNRSPHDVLAEDFYFFITNKKQSPFWEQWLNTMENKEMRSIDKTSLTKKATVSPLQLIDAVLDELAVLVLNAEDERLIADWGIAKDAVKAAQVQDQLSYENVNGPHQYFYPEDLNKEDRGPTTVPMKQPLEVSKPDVSIRDMTPGGGLMS